MCSTPPRIWIARQADDALDVVLAGARVLEHDHVAALGLGGEDAARQERAQVHPADGRAGRRGIAIGPFRDEQIVADQQRRFHRAGGNPEGLEQQGAEHAGDEQGVDDGLEEFAEPLPLFRARHHAP
jgi:hypothetical protein